jgi:hypothetical protein
MTACCKQFRKSSAYGREIKTELLYSEFHTVIRNRQSVEVEGGNTSVDRALGPASACEVLGSNHYHSVSVTVQASGAQIHYC